MRTEQQSNHLQLQTCETEIGFPFHSKYGKPKRPSPSRRLNTSNIFNLIAEICPFSVSIRSIWCPFEALIKRESDSPEVNSPTTPAVTPWRQPAVRTGWHPWLLRRLRAPLIVHQAIINPPVNQSIPAKVSWRTLHSRQNKARVGIDPLARARLHTIVFLAPVSLNNWW